MIFIKNRPSAFRLFFWSDDTFGLKLYDQIVSSSPLDTKSLWALFTPTQPRHATIILIALSHLLPFYSDVTVEKHIWSGWFPNFLKAVDPSKLPFTADFIPFHTKLVELMTNYFGTILRSVVLMSREWSDEFQSELKETLHAFYTHTKDYVVHLSLHPFALDDIESDRILDLLGSWYFHDCGHSLNKTYREDARKAMDASALSSSTPPFILTSELVCLLSNDEIINVIERIVALLDSDSSQSHPSAQLVQKSRKIN
ncbi:hypothetical protein BLNAU_5258 [Blattamonas nauphoetae]|uniref:Uncharacterized protein n=1 Tax=Blattamonas nauphoetae TaxID=2049346 RepID=A0ABQ9Y7W3_9EUKA|nr:hypothetical protein BLNAU_5258 [Blattamonas nauphoetae]